MASSEQARDSERRFFEVEGLSKHFLMRRGGGLRTFKAVDNISFVLAAGETLAIVGESGSGKSTLARTLLRLLEPTGGLVRLNGHDLFALSTAELRQTRRRVQMIFQDPYASLHPRRTVAEAISEPWRVHRDLVANEDRPARIAELLVQVGLSPAYADAYPTRLSGGERQRVAIARALAAQPDVLILDEPVSALDVSIQAQVIKLLMRLQQELGIAYIFISHDLPLVRLVADKVAVMYMGRFVEFGSAKEIYSDPQHPYTQSLLRSTPEAVADGENPEPVRADGENPIDLQGGCRFRPRCWKAQRICADQEPTLETARRGQHGCACHFAGGASSG
jgi:oligopeptide/dipeptide ABC transporter ATP-binding protein